MLRLSKGKKSLFNKNMLGKMDIHMGNNEVEPLPYTIYKNNLKWIKDLNLRAKTLIT